MNDELRHYGVKGQKWGVRRYQNKDGSLTPEGAKRYGSAENFTAERAKQKAKDIETIKSVKKASDAAQDVNREAGKIVKKHTDKKQAKADEAVKEAVRDNMQKMSDEELRAVVNRLNMEERYSQVMESRARIDMGKSKVEKFMDYSSTALTLASTGLSIALMIRELRK